MRRLAVVMVLVVAGCRQAPSVAPQTARPPEATNPSPIQPSPVQPSPVQPSPAQPSAEAGWRERAAAPVALTEVAAAAHRGAIWVAGGLDAEGRASDRVLVYEPLTDVWGDGPRLPEPIHHASLVSDGSALYILGGYTGEGFDRPTDAVRMLRSREESWLDHSRLLDPRAAGGAAWDGQRLVYAGGVGQEGVSPGVYADQGGAWALVGRLSEAREHLGATSDGAGSTFILGGRQGGLEGNRTAVDVTSAAVVRRLGDLPTPRGGVAAFWWPSLGACLVGGESPAGTNGQVECIAPSGETVALPALGVPRHGLGAAVIDGVAYVLLGGPEPGLFVSDVVEALVLPA